MTTKLPQGVAICIDERGVIFVEKELYRDEQINGLAFTFDQLLEIYQAIARAAFEAARLQIGIDEKPVVWDIDDYLASPEYKTLTGRGRMAIDMTCKICKFERAYLTGQVCISCQQERKELFQKVAIALIQNDDGESWCFNSICSYAKTATETILTAADKFTKEAKAHE